MYSVHCTLQCAVHNMDNKQIPRAGRMFSLVQPIVVRSSVHLNPEVRSSGSSEPMQRWGPWPIWTQRVLGPANPRGSSVHQIPEVRSSVHFLVSDLSDSLTIAHFLWPSGANCTWSLIFGELPERFALIAHFWWATWAIHSHCSPKKRKWEIRSFFQ